MAGAPEQRQADGWHGRAEDSLLSAIKLSTGASQVTYAGHPLYLYRGDSGPGDTAYVGANEFGGSWDALDATGRAVR